MPTRTLKDGTVLIGPNIDIGANQKMNLATGRVLHQNLPYEKIPDLLEDLSPMAVYSPQDLMKTGTDVIRLRRKSDDTEQDFTAKELTDGTYATFASGTTAAVVTLYDQVGSRDLTNATASSQPDFTGTTDLSVDFDADLLYSATENNPFATDTSFTIASHFKFAFSGNLGSGTVQHFGSIYADFDVGPGWGYGSVHLGNRMQLEFGGVSSTPPTVQIAARGTNNAMTSVGRAGRNITTGASDYDTTNFNTAIAKITGADTRSIDYKGTLTTEGTDTTLTTTSSVQHRFGLGGWNASGGTLRAFNGGGNIKATVFFNKILTDDETTILETILGAL